jgi:hypothetical protein
MKKELDYFRIENSFGGNQNWFHDPIMHMGGCAATTACDACIHMALYDEKQRLYPFDLEQLKKEDFIKFSAQMKPYLKPRLRGIDTLKLYIDGFGEYLQDRGEKTVQLAGYHGDKPVALAINEIKQQIDHSIPIPYLLLKHKSSQFKFFTWHWFMIVGYEEYEEEFYVKVATYGDIYWLSLIELWDTGYEEKGGMVILSKV